MAFIARLYLWRWSPGDKRAGFYSINVVQAPYLYQSRNLVEQFFNKIQQCRRIATWYDKLAANYFAIIKLASIGNWLRTYESTP